MDKPIIYRWGDIVAAIRGIGAGPNCLSISTDGNPVHDDAGDQQLTVHYEIDDVMYGIALFRTQKQQYVLRRITWLKGKDREIFRREPNTGRGVVPTPLQVQIQYWAMPDRLKEEADRNVASIRDVVLASAIACEADQKASIEAEADQPSVFTWVRVAFGGGRLIQSANFNWVSRSIRSIENKCDPKYCQPIEQERVREMFWNEPMVGRLEPLTSSDLMRLPFSLYHEEH